MKPIDKPAAGVYDNAIPFRKQIQEAMKIMKKLIAVVLCVAMMLCACTALASDTKALRGNRG